MVLLLPGHTKCRLCSAVILENDEVVGFPAFLTTAHRFHQFSDSVFHERCFEACPERDAVLAVYTRWSEIWDARPRDLKTLEAMEAWGIEAFRNFERDNP